MVGVMKPRTRWYLDTEFNEDGKTIELISIALVRQDGQKRYYAHSSDYEVSACNAFVRKHVLPQLANVAPRPKAQIASEVRTLLLQDGTEPEVWAYYAAYDWVVLCQLFGEMVDLPKGMQMHIHDLKQRMDLFGVSHAELPNAHNALPNAHNALEDALWLKQAFEHVEKRKLAFARKVLIEAMEADPDLLRGYLCNTAMALFDEQSIDLTKAEKLAGVERVSDFRDKETREQYARRVLDQLFPAREVDLKRDWSRVVT